MPVSCSATVNLPPGAQAGLSPDATPIGEVYRYTLRASPGFPPEEVRALQDWVVEKKFRTVPGVVDVNPFGGLTKQYQVLVDPAKLKSYNLTLQQVFTALSNGNNNAGGSYVEHGSELYVVRGLGLVRSAADIEDIAVDTRNGTPSAFATSARWSLATPCAWAALGVPNREGTRTTSPRESLSCAAARTPCRSVNGCKRWRTKSTANIVRPACGWPPTMTAPPSWTALCIPSGIT